MCHLTTLTPVSDVETEINHSIYWTQPWFDPLKLLFRPFARALTMSTSEAIGSRSSSDTSAALIELGLELQHRAVQNYCCDGEIDKNSRYIDKGGHKRCRGRCRIET